MVSITLNLAKKKSLWERISMWFNPAADSGTSINMSLEEWIDLNEQAYQSLRNIGWPAEDARQILPIGIDAPINIKADLREWRHIFSMRTSKKAHWEIRGVMCNLLVEVKQRIPLIFDDFEYKETHFEQGEFLWQL
jgi:thymidylate synthase ThyX